MKQLVQNIRTGESIVEDVPAPGVSAGRVLIRVASSLVSAGTERMIVEFGEKSLLDKARSRPDLVRQTLDKAARDGVLATFEAVQNRLDQPMALGYSVAGEVIAVGEGVDGLAIGDRVAAAGANQAVHAEVVSVPKNLVVRLPDAIDFDSAAFTTVGAIALQGVRLADVRLGELVAVIGLGLLGQITVQLLRANGCRVIGLDPQPQRAEMAKRFGAEESVATDDAFRAACARASNGRGADAVLITADTRSDGPVTLAGDVARDKGTVISVGAVGMNIPRKAYFEKELDFKVSRSYGPGRYDEAYEQQGIDYPYGFVRWTENRNMQAFVWLAGEGKLDLNALVTHRVDIADGARAYDLITGKSGEPFMGVLLHYPGHEPAATRSVTSPEAKSRAAGDVRVGLVGAGNFARAVLLPAMREANADLVGVAAASGTSARHAQTRFGFRYSTTDAEQIFGDSDINAVVIATRHDLHAAQTLRALRAGKHVFVEKPLCLTEQELDEIRETYAAHPAVLMVGFNRRFAPMSIALREHFRAAGEPLMIHYRVNGGFIPAKEWVQGEQGGGRLIGEGVHFIDWAVWLTGDVPERVECVAAANAGRYSNDNLSVVIRFRGGSVFQLLYVASGDRGVGKERVEVHGGGRSAVLEDFRRLELFANGRRSVTRSILRSDKGHRAGFAAFADAIRRGGPSPIPFEEIVTTTRAVFAARRSLTAQPLP
ncbi:MAG TPA: bi-domain-containing oxidoreductase [Thermoanaerobaculia bacterium]|nr:bi-domain-containing oxidoreductase [Thermoanaerobaculia bacterium]